jgi:hypothetical protein
MKRMILRDQVESDHIVEAPKQRRKIAEEYYAHNGFTSTLTRRTS